MSRTRIRVLRYDEDDPRVGPSVPDRLFSAGMLALAEQLVDEAVLQDGWDAPPVLGLLFQRRRTPVEPGASFHGLSFDWVPLGESTPALARSPRPHNVVVAMAQMLRGLSPEEAAGVVPPSLVAVGLLNEGWGLFLDKTTTSAQEMQRVKKASRNWEIHREPDRVEVKLLTAVDINGVRYGIVKPRDPRMKREAIVGVLDVKARSGLGGEVATSLHYLMEVCQGRTVPSYEAWSQTHDIDTF